MKTAFTLDFHANRIFFIFYFLFFVKILNSQVPSCEVNPNYCYNRWFTTNLSPCWKQLGINNITSIIDFCFVDSNTGYYIGGSQSGNNQIFKTINGGLTYNLVYTNALFSFDNSSKIIFISPNIGCIATFKDRTLSILNTIDGGNSWSLAYNSNAYSGLIKDLKYVSSNFVIALLNGYIIQSKDNFKTVSSVNFSDLNKNLKIVSLNINNILLVGDSYTYLSTDEGKTYKIGKKFINVQDAKVYSNKYYVYANGEIYSSIDGVNWTLQNIRKTDQINNGEIGILSDKVYLLGSSLTYDGGCTSSNYSNSFLKIIQVNNQLFSFNSQYIYKFICNINNIYEMPHDQTYLAHPLVLPNKSSSTLNLNNLLSIHGTNILGIPLPQCWFDNTRIDFPYYLYFKGTGKAYSFKINALNNFQAAILSGKLECLKVNACVERNNFSTKDVLEINTKLNEDYYLLIDQNNLSNFTLEFKEIPVTPINDSEKLIDFHGFKKENKILVAVNTNNNREFNIFVFDYSGKKCFERKFKKEISIPTEFLSSGLYLLVLVDLTNNNSLVKKISI